MTVDGFVNAVKQSRFRIVIMECFDLARLAFDGKIENIAGE